MRCSIIKVFHKLLQYFSTAGAGSLLWYKMRMIWLIQLASYFYPRLLVWGTFYLECFLSDNFHSVSLKIFLVFWINDSSRGFSLGTYIHTHTQMKLQSRKIQNSWSSLLGFVVHLSTFKIHGIQNSIFQYPSWKPNELWSVHPEQKIRTIGQNPFF